MIRRGVFFLLCVCGTVLFAAGKSEPMKTGSKLEQLASPLFVDGSNRTLNDFLGKKFVVLHIWERSPAALNEFPRAANMYANLRDQVEFIGVGVGDVKTLKNYPGVVRLGFPVNSDRGEMKKIFHRPGDPMPLTVLLDKNGVLLWRGKLAQLPGMIKMCESGKFDLKEQIRNEVFADEVNEAIRKNQLDKALAMMAKEYQDHPEKFELLRVQFSILKKLNRRQDALKLLHNAQEKHPADHRIFEMEYLLLGENSNPGEIKEFFTRVKKQFSRHPEVLIAFAVAESKVAPEKLDPALIVDLAAAGWKKELFTKPGSRAAYALEYAMIMHIFGRNEIACGLAEIACKEAEKIPALLKKAEAARAYYRKIRDISPAIKMPDLKK